jgi:hypothetical protein
MEASSPYVRYVTLLVLLDDEMREGRSDDAQADDFRNEMDGLWEKLTEEQVKRIEILSELLYQAWNS